MSEEHEQEIKTLKRNHEKDLLQYNIPTRDSDDELTELKRRLCLLEEGYEAQIAQLKKQYAGTDDDHIRQQYQLEIEHLRVSI